MKSALFCTAAIFFYYFLFRRVIVNIFVIAILLEFIVDRWDVVQNDGKRCTAFLMFMNDGFE
jgi:hypothetical protein